MEARANLPFVTSKEVMEKLREENELYEQPLRAIAQAKQSLQTAIPEAAYDESVLSYTQPEKQTLPESEKNFEETLAELDSSSATGASEKVTVDPAIASALEALAVEEGIFNRTFEELSAVEIPESTAKAEYRESTRQTVVTMELNGEPAEAMANPREINETATSE